jgi:hypothetical protein
MNPSEFDRLKLRARLHPPRRLSHGGLSVHRQPKAAVAIAADQLQGVQLLSPPSHACPVATHRARQAINPAFPLQQSPHLIASACWMSAADIAALM